MSRRRVTIVLLACAASAAAILSGCGGGGGGSGNVDVGPAAAVPANAPLYFAATVRPTGTAESNAAAALGKILDTKDPGAKLISLIDQEGQKQNPPSERFTYQQDIAPWLGEQAGAFFTSFTGEGTGAVVIETTNPETALAFTRKSESGATTQKQQNGITYYLNPSDGDSFATVGDFLVFGDEADVKAAIDADQGDSLGDSGDFKDAIDDLPDDRLGTFYTVPRHLLDAIPSGQIGASQQALLENSAGESLDEPVSGALTASAESLDLDFTGGANGVETPESPLIGQVPAQSWLAIGYSDLGAGVKRALDQLKATTPMIDTILSQIESTTGATTEELTAALGDAALYVEGTTQSTLTGALVIQTKDPDLIGRLLNQFRGLLQLRGGVKPLTLSGGGTGFQIKDPSLARAPVEIALQGDKLVIGYGANSAERTLTPADTLDGRPSFTAGKEKISSLGTDFFLSFPAVFKLAAASGANGDPGFVQAKPYIDALDYLVSGSGTKNDQTEVKAVLGLK